MRPSTYSEYLDAEKHVRQGLPYRILFLRDFTVEPLLPVIRVECSRMGMDAQITVSGYTPMIDATKWEYETPFDCVLVARWNRSAGNIIEAIRAHTDAPIIVDSEDARGFPNAYTVWYMSDSGRSFNSAEWSLSQMPYTSQTAIRTARDYCGIIRALVGKTKKCLVIDADYTLWDGILGEDGVDKIAPYQEFQEDLVALKNRGVLLALCTKNNPADIQEVFEKRDMPLKAEHLVIIKANWNPKPDNIRQIAQDLNIGLDSLVFVDDSQFECDLVGESLPEVDVLKAHGDSADWKSMWRGLFDAISRSDEDTHRTEMYRADLQRKEIRATSITPEDYLKSLKMTVTIGRATEAEMSRVAQLTQKTNQFNLTTTRRTEDDIRQMVNDGCYDVFYLKLEDRVSDLGLVGVAIVCYEGKTVTITDFLLSCRALGRKVEDVLLSHVMDESIKRGCDDIVGLYTPSAKNGQVANFYRDHYFFETARGGWASIYHSLKRPAYIRVKIV